MAKGIIVKIRVLVLQYVLVDRRCVIVLDGGSGVGRRGKIGLVCLLGSATKG